VGALDLEDKVGLVAFDGARRVDEHCVEVFEDVLERQQYRVEYTRVCGEMVTTALFGEVCLATLRYQRRLARLVFC